MTDKKHLFLIDSTGDRTITEDERNLLPSGNWHLVVTDANKPASSQVKAIIWRTTQQEDLCAVVESANNKLTPGCCVIIVGQPSKQELLRLGNYAKQHGIQVRRHANQTGEILLRFETVAISTAPTTIHTVASGTKFKPSTLSPAQHDFLRLVFDEKWYLGQHPIINALVKQGAYHTAEEYFLAQGANAGHSPGPLFHSAWLMHQGVPATFLHYINKPAGASSCPLFAEDFYLKRNPDIATAIQQGKFVSGYHHFINCGYGEGRRPHPFVLPYSTRKKLGFVSTETAQQDWLDMVEGRSQPGVLFDANWYRAMHQAELICHGLTAQQHFSRRSLCQKASPLPDFDANYYRNANPDLKDIDDLALHFLQNGIQEERRPNDYFDPNFYLSAHPQVAKEIGELGLLGAFEHFMLLGAKQGLRAHPPLAQMNVPEREAKSIFERQAERIAADIRMGQKIHLPISPQPTVSIVIPVVDNFAFTVQLLKQLAHFVQTDTEVIVIDAASKDETRNLEQHVDNVRITHLAKRASFAANCNLGAKQANGETLVFMNNDITLEPDALENAIRRLHSEANIGCVGGRILRSHGLIQEAGNVIWSNGSTQGVGREEQANAHNLHTVRDVDMCSACFIAVKRNVFEQIGGYDEIFDPGYCEDADLAIRIRATGHRIVYDPSVVVHHYEYGSYARGRPPSTSAALILAHQEILRSKHADSLKLQPPPGSLSPLFAADHRYRQGNTLLLIEDRPPEKHLGSGYVRTVDIIQGLRSQGYNVVVWARERGYHQSACYSDLAGIDVVHAEDYAGSLGQFLNQNRALFQAIWVCRTHNFSLYYPELQSWKSTHPDGLLIADTEAISATREIEQLKVFGLDTTLAQEKLKQEINALSLADRILAVSHAEQQLIRQHLPDKDCRRLAHMPDFPRKTPARSVRQPFEGRQSFGFLGAVHSLESPNLDSILWLCNECFPLIRQRLPEATLRIAGYWDARIPKDLVSLTDGIEWLGPVEDLDAFFSATRVFLAPTRFAAGLPQKIASAIAQGVPCVISPLLHTQMGWTEEACYLAPTELTAESYAELAVQLYSNAKAWAQVRKAGLAAVERDFGADNFRLLISKVLK